MKIQRTIPPAAAPVGVKSLAHGFAGMIFGGKYRKRFEQELKDYFKVNHVFMVSSGKAALTIILRALKSLSPGKREVLIPAYTCFSVPSAIVKAGLTVSLCDINDSTFDFDSTRLGRELNERTLCVIPNHLFGIPSDMDGIRSACSGRGIFIVEDAAQAMGGRYKEKKLGTIGDVGFFSLGRGKNITSGSGGVIITDSDSIAAAIEKECSLLGRPNAVETAIEYLKALMLAIFTRPALYWLPAGLPFLKLGETVFYKDFAVKRFSGMKAGLARGWQGRLERSNQTRQGNAEYFCKLLGLSICSDFPLPFLRLPIVADSRKMRNSIYSLSRERGLGISCMYPTAVNEIKEIKDTFSGEAYPSARRVAERILTLPTHEFLSEKDKRKIVQFIKRISFSGDENAQPFYKDGYPVPELDSINK